MHTIIDSMSKAVFSICCLIVVLSGLQSCSSEEGLHRLSKKVLNLPRDLATGIFTDVRSFDVYTEAGVIHALLAGKLGNEQGSAVAYLKSRDGGAHWSKLVWVYRQKSPVVISKRGNDIQLAVHKNQIVAAWRIEDELPGMGPMVLASSEDAGQSWTTVKTPAVGDITHNQGYMDLVADRDGWFHLVWLDDREENGNTQGLRYVQSGNGGRRWSVETTLASETCTCCWNKLALAEDQTLNVLFRGVEPRDMTLIQLSRDQIWSTPKVVGAFDWQFVGCPHEGGGLAAIGNDYHAVVWTGQESQAGLYYLSSNDGGVSWQVPVKMGGGFSRHGDVAVSGTTEVALVWDSMTASGSAIMMRQLAVDGNHWSDAVILTEPGVYATHPRILDSGEGFQVFWTEKQTSGVSKWVMANF